MARRRASQALSLLAAGLLLATAAGCSGGGDDGDEPDRAPSSTSDASDGTSPSENPETSETPPPAEGQEVSTDGVTMTLPTRFETSLDGQTRLTAAYTAPNQARTDIAVITISNLGSPTDVDGAYDFFADLSSYLREPKRVADTEIDGVPVFHLSGPISNVQTVEVYGANSTQYAVNIEFRFDTTVPEAEREATVAEVLPTIRFT